MSTLMHRNHTGHSHPIGMAGVSSLLQLLLFIVLFILVAHSYNFICCMIRLRRDRRCFEGAPKGKRSVVRVCNVTKKLGKTWAVKNASFNLYKGEVAVLMGNNASGKTTLLSIISGVTRPSCGTVCVANSYRGWCPQNNVFVPDFTVSDHLRLFNSIRGFKSNKELYKCLNLSNKSGYYPDQLCGGEKRKFQLACAMTGGSKILILDEPMSGMDVITRNEVWALLVSLRGRATVLLTNYHADTASAMGDRVITMNSGVVTTHASPTHLKPDVYRLFMTHTSEEKYCECKVAQIVEAEVPGAELIRPSPGCISYYLPTHHRDKYARLFNIIEDRQKELGVTTMRLGRPILKEGFITQCSASENQRDCLCREMNVYDDYERTKGWRLAVMQTWQLIKRQFFYIFDTLAAFLFVHVLLLLALILLTKTDVWKPIDAVTQHSVTKMTLDNYKSIKLGNEATYKGAVALYRKFSESNLTPKRKIENLFPLKGNGYETFLEDIKVKTWWSNYHKRTMYTNQINAKWYTSLHHGKSDNDSSLYNDDEVHLEEYIFYDMFYKLNKTTNLVPLFNARPELNWFNHSYYNHSTFYYTYPFNIPKRHEIRHYVAEYLHLVDTMHIRVSAHIPHTGPAGINGMWNARAKALFNADNPITAKGWPIRTSMAPLYDYWNRMFETVYVSTIYLSALLCCVGLSSSERWSGSRRMLLATNLSPLLFWTLRLIFHLIFYMLLFATPLMFYLNKHTVGENFIWCTFLIFLTGTISCLSFIFMMSFFLKDPLDTIMLVFIFYSGVCLAAIHSFFTYVEYKMHRLIPLELVLPISELLLPSQTFTMAVIRTCMAPMIWPTEHTKDGQKIIGNVLKIRDYYPYRNIIILSIQAIIFSVIVNFIESGFIRRFLNYSSALTFKKPQRSKKTDKNVIKEEQYVKRFTGESVKKEASKEYDYKGPIIRPANLCYTRRGPIVVSSPDDAKAKAKAAAKAAKSKGKSKNTENQSRSPIKKAPAKANNPDALLVNELHKAYFGVKPNPVSGLTFSVKNGEIFGLYGPSGCGKTTAYKMLAVQIGADDGVMCSGGEYFTNYTKRGSFQKMIGYSGEQCELDKFLTARQALTLHCALRGIGQRDRYIKRHAWLTLFGLQRYAGRKIYKCSSGYRRLISSAAACCVDAPVTVLDAAGASLDGDSRRLLWLGAQYIRKDKRGVLISQHCVEELEQYCDRVAAMRAGDLRALGPPHNLKFNYKIAFTITFYFFKHVDEKNDDLSKFSSELNNMFIVRNTYYPIIHIIAVYQVGHMPYSKLFERLEKLKNEHPDLVRDYEVSENTLEDSLTYIIKGKNVA